MWEILLNDVMVQKSSTWHLQAGKGQEFENSILQAHSSIEKKHSFPRNTNVSILCFPQAFSFGTWHYYILKAEGGTASSSFVSSLVKQILLRTFTTLHFLYFKMQVTHIWCKSTVDTCPWWFNISFNIFSVPKHRNKRLKLQPIHSVLYFTVIESICIQCWSNENLEVCDVINKYRNH